MSVSKKILIIAGEESGDMYGANIIQKLSKNQNITFYAMGASKMQMTNAKIIVDSSKLSVVGFFEILRISKGPWGSLGVTTPLRSATAYAFF